jgi:hypothetical protein
MDADEAGRTRYQYRLFLVDRVGLRLLGNSGSGSFAPVGV